MEYDVKITITKYDTQINEHFLNYSKFGQVKGNN